MSSSSNAEASQSKSPVPANLRFQRRTSERAFYEGAFKPGMDYSAINSDQDHGQGASPWASSPQHTRANFGAAATTDVPSNNLSHSSYTRQSQEVDHSDRPSTAGSSTLAQSENGDSTHSPYQQQRSGQQYTQEQHYQSQPQYHQQQQRPYQQGPGQDNSHHRSEPQRYHSARPQQQKPAPQYKLSAKITALERTGRKDSILRFDVYVRLTFSECIYSLVR